MVDANVSNICNANNIFIEILCTFTGIFFNIFPTIFVTNGCKYFINRILPIPHIALKDRVIREFKFKKYPSIIPPSCGKQCLQKEVCYIFKKAKYYC